MMPSLEDLRSQYEGIRPDLDAIVSDVRDWLTVACRDLGIYAPRIDGRSKETHSFLLKVIRREQDGRPYSDPLQEMSDLAGVRADLVYASDIERLVERIRLATDYFEPIPIEDIDDKQFELEEDKIGYIGVHIDVTPVVCHGLDAGVGRCEIQIRTNAQAAWAMASHELLYKPLIDLPARDRRRMYRLSALVEMFDEQIAGVHETMTGTDGYPEAIIAQGVINLRFRIIGSDFDHVLTREIVGAICPAKDAKSAHELLRQLDAFVGEHSEKLGKVLRSTHPVLSSQPEAILVFYRLEEDQFSLQEAWPRTGLSNSRLVELADTWGVALPEPL